VKSTVDILEGNTFVVSDVRGDIDGTPVEPHGFFANDTRFLSKWILTVNGERPASLSVDETRYYGAQFFLAPSTGTTYVDSSLAVIRKRVVLDGFHDWLTVINYGAEPAVLELVLDAEADFADLFEVKDATAGQKKGQPSARAEADRLVFGYERGTFKRETWIRAVSGSPEYREDGLRFSVTLRPQERWDAEIDVIPIADPAASPELRSPSDWEDPSVRLGLRKWALSVPELSSSWDPLDNIYRRALGDLAALRFAADVRPDKELPAAGLPWFMTVFGRDSIITSYQALPFVPELAEAALLTLGDFQARTVDHFRDSEPGKILHEMRYGELTAFEERPHSPYYGSVDSTMLYLILLDEFERWTGRVDLVRELEPVARAALAWIDAYGDRDGDGYVEYERRNTATGLENQCWKDSWNSIQWADGRIAELPRATCELQGYVYDAKNRCARLARVIWNDPALAARLENEAAALKERFNRDFWLVERGYYALALDGKKRPVDALASNVGHLLWSGIVDDDKAPRVVEHLMGDRLFSGWGIRTFATGQAGYNPIGYHLGTVWPHDTALCVMGLRRYGYRVEAARVAMALLEAAELFGGRLPEAFAGFTRADTAFPVEYPTACSPQAWASGAPLMIVWALLGLAPDGAILRANPELPEQMRALRLGRIPGRWGRAEVGVDGGDAVIFAVGHGADAGPASALELFEQLANHIDPATTHGVQTSFRFDLADAGSWRIVIDNGRVVVSRDREDAECIFETDEPTLLGIIRGEQNANTAVLSGKVKVHGDLALALKIQQFLSSNLTGFVV
jgi:glycogen debranching enzyme/putative sterol carrier protein